MGFDVDFCEPYLEASEGTIDGIPQVFSVSIGSHVYTIDTSFEPYRRDAFRHRSIQAQRDSIDLTNIPGEGTVNTEGLWRRGADDWHTGAGQPFQDRKGSDDTRFSVSKGIDPWCEWQISLLDDTTRVYSTTNNVQVLQVGKYVYVLEIGTATLKFSDDLVTWTAVTGLDSDCRMMATDGYDLWVANALSATGNGIFSTTAGASSASAYVTSFGATGVWWAAERLMAAGLDSSIYNITASGSSPTALWTHPNANFRWNCCADGSSQIYLGGYDTGQGQPLASSVYRTTVEATGTALQIPVVALPLDGGEYVTSLYGYLNYVFVGSNLGVRMCRTISAYDPTGNEGDLEAGPLSPGLFPPGPIANPVMSMVGNNRFVYFGWTDFDTVSTGIGRMDLATFIDTQSPAYAADLMVTGQGTVSSLDWSTKANCPLIGVDGKGVYVSSGSPVESGYVDSGYVTFGIPDDKVVMAGDIGTITPQQGTVSMGLSADGAPSAVVGVLQSTADGGSPNSAPFAISQVRGEKFVVRTTLTRDPVTGQSPIVHRWMLKALPALTAGTTISCVINAYGPTIDENGQDRFLDPYAELDYLENLRTTQTVVEYREGPYSALVTVDEIDWLPFKRRDGDPEGGFEGNLIVYLKSWDLGT